MTQPAQAKAGIITDAMKHVAEVEMVSPETIRAAVATGTVVIPANINHKGLVPPFDHRTQSGPDRHGSDV